MGLTYVLDASAVLRYIDNEAGADRVEEIVLASHTGQANILVSANHWGEIFGHLSKRSYEGAPPHPLVRLRSLPLRVATVDAQRAERSATIRLRYKMPYVDSFALELLGASPDHILVTADFDFKPAEADFRIEFLPQKPKP